MLGGTSARVADSEDASPHGAQLELALMLPTPTPLPAPTPTPSHPLVSPTDAPTTPGFGFPPPPSVTAGGGVTAGGVAHTPLPSPSLAVGVDSQQRPFSPTGLGGGAAFPVSADPAQAQPAAPFASIDDVEDERADLASISVARDSASVAVHHESQDSVRTMAASKRHVQLGMASQRKVAPAPAAAATTGGGFFSSVFSNTPLIDKLPPLPPPLRIAIVGAPKTGKTQLINRLLTGCYERHYHPTQKIEIGLKLLQDPSTGTSYALEVWDIPSVARQDALLSAYLSQMDGALVLTDASDLRSFQSVRRWSDMFATEALTRLADNLQALGVEDDLSAHSLPGVDGRPALVSPFPAVLFANKADSERCTLTHADIIESASHFKLSYGFLGSVLLNRPMQHGLPPGESLLPSRSNLTPALSSAAASVAALSTSDGCVEQVFHFLLLELLRYQHLRALHPSLSSVGPQGSSVRRTDLPSRSRDESSITRTSRAQAAGLMSKKILSTQPSVPLPASLASLKLRNSPAAGTRSSNKFDFAAALQAGSGSGAAPSGGGGAGAATVSSKPTSSLLAVPSMSAYTPTAAAGSSLLVPPSVPRSALAAVQARDEQRSRLDAAALADDDDEELDESDAEESDEDEEEDEEDDESEEAEDEEEDEEEEDEEEEDEEEEEEEEEDA